MIGSYRVLPAADRDLDEQADYLATAASLETALRFYDAARSTFGKLADMPGMGEKWEVWRDCVCGASKASRSTSS
jgi:plasmid stabilization system protein ParE